jgi:hypothetical protein
MLEWKSYPESNDTTELLKKVVHCFEVEESRISSASNKNNSDRVLEILQPGLTSLGFEVEDKRKGKSIKRPVLFGRNGKWQKWFKVDAFHQDERTAIEIEAGRAYTNFQFLKDIFEACVMYDVEYLAIAVRRTYIKNKDFEKILDFMDTLYASGRLHIPLKGIVIIGY